MSSVKTYICLDIGGTYIKHGLLTETGEILTKGKVPTRAKEGGQAVFEQAVELVEGYLEKEKMKISSGDVSGKGETELPRSDRGETFIISFGEMSSAENDLESDKEESLIRQTQAKSEFLKTDEAATGMQDPAGGISGITISTAGMVDPETGTILHASDAIPGYAGISYKAYMEERFHLPCAVENDVNCAGLAESISGAGKESRINLCLTVGTGIGGCFVVDGKIFHGASNSACEVGYMHLAPGAFQDEAATSALVRRVTERKRAEAEKLALDNGKATEEHGDSAEIPLDENGDSVAVQPEEGENPTAIRSEKNGDSATTHTEAWDGFRIFEAAKAGDPICQEELDRLADLLGMGIANICFVINPERIILGGGIMEQEAYMKPRIEAALEKYLVPQIWKHTTVCMAAYQNNAGMLGALYHLQAEI